MGVGPAIDGRMGFGLHKRWAVVEGIHWEQLNNYTMIFACHWPQGWLCVHMCSEVHGVASHCSFGEMDVTALNNTEPNGNIGLSLGDQPRVRETWSYHMAMNGGSTGNAFGPTQTLQHYVRALGQLQVANNGNPMAM